MPNYIRGKSAYIESKFLSVILTFTFQAAVIITALTQLIESKALTFLRPILACWRNVSFLGSCTQVEVIHSLAFDLPLSDILDNTVQCLD
jgi:hypothetical protein